MAGAGLVAFVVAAFLLIGPRRPVMDVKTLNDRYGEETEYIVVDLSGGPKAVRYSVTPLTSVPEGGWPADCRTTRLVLRRIRPGMFAMGSSVDEDWRRGDETQHAVRITKDYFIGVYELTQRQYALIMGEEPACHFRGNVLPVDSLSYEDIRGGAKGASWPADGAVDRESLIGRLRAKTDFVFDLPTEAEWEYACRAGTETAFNVGRPTGTVTLDELLDDLGWYHENSGRRTRPVGQKKPNAWGLYDMHGNVWEWCLDWYVDNLDTETVTDPVGAPSGDFRVERGGCWGSIARGCRSANRMGIRPSTRLWDLGLRLACRLETPR